MILNLLTNHRDRLKDEAPDESLSSTAMYAVPGTTTEETIMHNNLLEQIRALRLGHMSNALELQWSQPMTYTSLSFEGVWGSCWSTNCCSGRSRRSIACDDSRS